mgnify:FL=1
MIEVKTSSEVEIIRDNANILGQIIEKLTQEIKPGIKTIELDRYAEKLIRDAGGDPAFKGYRGFPSSLCTSINEEIVHGIPSERSLQEGDIISLDIGLKKNGFYSDAATTVPVGRVEDEVRALMNTANNALTEGFDYARVGNRVSDISHAIGSFVKRRGFYVVKEFVGHGIGRQLHEDPQIQNYGDPGKGKRLKEGMVFAIEPMVKTDDQPVKVLDDGWTAVTGSGGLSTHFEGMVHISENGPEILVRGGE